MKPSHRSSTFPATVSKYICRRLELIVFASLTVKLQHIVSVCTVWTPCDWITRLYCECACDVCTKMSFAHGPRRSVRFTRQRGYITACTCPNAPPRSHPHTHTPARVDGSALLRKLQTVLIQTSYVAFVPPTPTLLAGLQGETLSTLQLYLSTDPSRSRKPVPACSPCLHAPRGITAHEHWLLIVTPRPLSPPPTHHLFLKNICSFSLSASSSSSLTTFFLNPISA